MQELKIIADPKLLSKLSFFILTGLSFPTLATFPNVASMLDAYRLIAPIAAPEINDLIISLDALSGQQLDDALQTLTPVVDGSLRAASDAAMRQTFSAIADRLLLVPQNQQDCPPPPEVWSMGPNGVWARMLGSDIDQESVDDVPGYRAYMLGGIIGRDLRVCPQVMVGAAGGYQYAKVNSHGPSGSFLNIKRLQGTAYGRYDSAKRLFYAQAAFTLARNQYENNRKILVPPYSGIGFTNIAQAEFVAWEVQAYLEDGYDWKKRNFHFIPKMMLSYSHLNPEGYIEKDAFSLNLNVKYKSMNYLDLGAGVQCEYHNLYPKAYVNPEIHGYVFYDFLQDKQFASANMLGGGFAFLSQGVTPAAFNYEVGAGIAIHSYKKTLVKLQYDYVGRSNYERQQAFIKVRHEWD